MALTALMARGLAADLSSISAQSFPFESSIYLSFWKGGDADGHRAVSANSADSSAPTRAASPPPPKAAHPDHRQKEALK